MAGKMVKCKHCGADIAKSAAVCPQCGGKNKGSKGVGCLIVIIVVIVGMVMIISQMGKDGSSSSSPTGGENTASSNGEDLGAEWKSAYLYKEEFGESMPFAEAIAKKSKFKSCFWNDVGSSTRYKKATYTGEIKLWGKDGEMTLNMLWDRQNQNLLPLNVKITFNDPDSTVKDYDPGYRFMQGMLYTCYGYDDLGERLISEAMEDENRLSFWSETGFPAPEIDIDDDIKSDPEIAGALFGIYNGMGDAMNLG